MTSGWSEVRELERCESRAAAQGSGAPIGRESEEVLGSFTHVGEPLVLGLAAVPPDVDLLDHHGHLERAEDDVVIDTGAVVSGSGGVSIDGLIADREIRGRRSASG